MTGEGGTNPRGKLELTWGNKSQRLLSHGVNTYEWVHPADWRISEVRLLHPVAVVGDAACGNLLVTGDALHLHTALTSLPELRDQYLGKVRCVYINPPFNTCQVVASYDDAVEHSVWLTMLRDRLNQIGKLLAPTGSVWVHGPASVRITRRGCTSGWAGFAVGVSHGGSKPANGTGQIRTCFACRWPAEPAARNTQRRFAAPSQPHSFVGSFVGTTRHHAAPERGLAGASGAALRHTA